MLNDIGPVILTREAKDALVVDVGVEEGNDVQTSRVLDVDVVFFK